MTTTNHLTPAELDALLEVATWRKESPTIDGVYWWRADAKDPEPDIHLVVAGYFYEAGMMKREQVENFGGEWLEPVDPATITRLVLMVRELQREVEELAGQLINSADRSGELLLTLQHFRVRVISTIRHADVHDSDCFYRTHNGACDCLHGATLKSIAATIESLPLVETEGE